MAQNSTRVKVANAPVRPKFHEVVYNPLDAQRRCSRCGQTDRWRQWHGEPAGGWICCVEPADITVHGTLDHQCSELCSLAVPA